jgi:elongation factor Ts
MVTTEQIKELRDETGVSIMQCKKALEEAGGDHKKALVILRKKSSEVATKKADRRLGSGIVDAYVHNTRAVGALVLLSCETDFVAKNEEFRRLAYDIAMHVTATDPEFLRSEEVTPEAKRVALEVFQKEVEGKPEDLKDKILKGKLDSYFQDKILLEQKFIKDPEQTIGELIEAAIQKFGEKIEITRFVRFSVSK